MPNASNDPFGRRLWKDVSGVKTYYHYADEGLVGEYDSSGNEIKSYGYQPDSTWGTDPLFMKVGTAYYFYHNDHLGTPQKMTASNGAVVWSAKYDSFGDATVDVATVENNLRFPGQYFDAETGLHYNWFRYYDPEVGRYLRVDPIGFGGGQSNLYGYVLNDPINSIDPLGLTNWGQVIGGGVKIVGGGFAIAGGVALSETGVGLLGIPIGESAIAWGLADVIAGFNDKEIPYSGTVDLAIKESTNPGLTQDGLSGINGLTGMLIGVRGASVAYDSVNSVVQNANSIYNSGSTIIDAINGNDADSPCK